MSTPPPPYLPTAALVAVAWIGQRALLPEMVATRLPRNLPDWADQGFAQVTIVPGFTEVDSGGRRRTIAQIDAWGINLAADGSAGTRPAVNKANRIAEFILFSCEDREQSFGKPVTLPEGYLPARVLAAYPMMDPSPVPDDPSGYGRVTFDLALDWVRI